ncbi:PREDICTED: pectin acetylesterase 8-like isoform X2 [Nicotiana attenuata]|uniref:pectin acetylesterase 8-like isoform X2 n=1 Tax=Nicotiana attenuata TaxID=49451 RepID=UPI0009058AF0|nr:PREDICTED: pectin acetylesterase 8-like isoform X2 [Nicotiana attenuata]
MMELTFLLALLACPAVLCTTTTLGGDDSQYVNITILHRATTEGAVCLDGSPPAYHLDMGHGSGLRSWIIVMDGGAWCQSIPDCLSRSTTNLGSSKHMKKVSWFAGVLYHNPQNNPEFYNWNRVRVKYCDGSSFTGDVEQVDPDNKLFFRGARIFNAIMEDLGSKGMQYAENAILSGISAGGLATILNCNKFKSLLPKDVRVKCVADAGFFINGQTISGASDIQEMYQRVVTLHESAKNLPLSCTSAMEPSLIENILVPKYLDRQHVWDDCKKQISNCTFSQRLIIQVFGVEFLKVFEGLTPSFTRGYFTTSCHSHGAILSNNYWFSPTSPRLIHKDNW